MRKSANHHPWWEKFSLLDQRFRLNRRFCQTFFSDRTMPHIGLYYGAVVVICTVGLSPASFSISLVAVIGSKVWRYRLLFLQGTLRIVWLGP